MLVLALLLDYLYRRFFLKQPADDMLLIFVGAQCFWVRRSGLVATDVEAFFFKRFPIFVLAIGTGLSIILGVVMVVLILVVVDDLSWPVRIVLALGMLALGAILVKFLLRLLERLNSRIENSIARAAEAEEVIYSDEPVDAVTAPGQDA